MSKLLWLTKEFVVTGLLHDTFSDVINVSRVLWVSGGRPDGVSKAAGEPLGGAEAAGEPLEGGGAGGLPLEVGWAGGLPFVFVPSLVEE